MTPSDVEVTDRFVLYGGQIEKFMMTEIVILKTVVLKTVIKQSQ